MSRINRIKFSTKPPGADRIHYINEEDVRVLLGRLPGELWTRLREVHFVDQSRGGKILGYVTKRGRDAIAICSLPPRFRLRLQKMDGDYERYGAVQGKPWPYLALRRFQLYHTFLHELGHLQIVDPRANTFSNRFAHEKLTEEFTLEWQERLWAEPFDHPDPVHNAPTEAEAAELRSF